jgi:hypothetical protein
MVALPKEGAGLVGLSTGQGEISSPTAGGQQLMVTCLVSLGGC